ncbi:MAG: UDP-N-acetylmuramoyl-tripeptide--D-alanyl-D-alanine ligase [bacterium]
MMLDTRILCRAASGRLISGDHRPLGPISIDSRTTPPDATFFCIRGPRFDGHRFADRAAAAGARVVVADRRGVTALPAGLLDAGVTVIVVADTIRALGRLAAAARVQFKGTVIGLTGSSGKTTTKELIAAVLRVAGPVLATEGNLNNELGVPLTLLRLTDEHRYAVIEMGMSARGEISYLASLAMPRIGVITTVGAAHLQGLGSVRAIARAKGELLGALPSDGLAIIPSHVRYPWILTGGLRAPLMTVGEREVDEIRLIETRATPDGITGLVEADGHRELLTLRLAGRHNLHNALLALAVGRELGVPLADACRALAAVDPPAMRGELRTLPDGARVVLDCYNANPQSMRVSIATFVEHAQDGLLVLGDMLELGPTGPAAHREIGALIAALPGAIIGDLTLVAVGPLSEQIVTAARAGGMPEARALHAEDAAEAARAVARLRRPGQPILLKASRGIHLERVYTALTEESAP